MAKLIQGLWQDSLQVVQRLTGINLVLHDQLLAAQHHLPGPRHQGGPSPQQHMAPSTASPRDQANIDPAISGAAMMGAAPPQTPTQPQQGSPESVSPKTYGKRELSTSKRAAQNRAAQVCLLFARPVPPLTT